MQQRAIVTVASVAAGLIYLGWAGFGLPADGSGGCTLLFACSPPAAFGMFVLLSVPVLVLAALSASSGNVLSGVFVISAGLTFAAVEGGPIEDWLHSIAGPGAFVLLAVETAAWAALIAAALALCAVVRPALRKRLPAFLTGQPPDEQNAAANPGAAPSVGNTKPRGATDQLLVQTRDRALEVVRRRVAWSPSLGALAVTVLLAYILEWFLLRSPDTWQVVWVLIIAFALSSLAAHQIYPQTALLAVLLGPLVLAAAAYLWVAMGYDSAADLREGYYNFHGLVGGREEVPQIAVALPIFYASAGVCGATLGLGWSQAIGATRRPRPARK